MVSFLVLNNFYTSHLSNWNKFFYGFLASTEQTKELQRIHDLFERIVVIDNQSKSLNSKSHFLPGLLMNNKVMKIQYLFNIFNIIFLLCQVLPLLFEDLKEFGPIATHNIQQDELERYFGNLRNKGGNNRSPTQLTHMRTVAKQLFCEEKQVSEGKFLIIERIESHSIENSLVRFVL